MATDVWNKRFGVFIASSECPIEGCSNTILKNRYCLGELNHCAPGAWEIDNSIEIKKGDNNLLNKRPICCECNSKKNDNINA